MVLVRHGEPDASVRRRCYGRLDPALSPDGRRQMERTWALLTDLPIAAVYSSPRRRAVESAMLRGADDPAVQLDERLREIDFGGLEGLTYEEIASAAPALFQDWMTHPTQVRFPDGEDFVAMRKRVLAAFDDIRRAHESTTVVTVSHGGVNRIALAGALSLHPRHMFRIDQTYAGVNVIDWFGDEPLVRLINGVPWSC
jgi:alpha-ribazole phosphatase/probable phosphoglycerate mutase